MRFLGEKEKLKTVIMIGRKFYSMSSAEAGIQLHDPICLPFFSVGKILLTTSSPATKQRSICTILNGQKSGLHLNVVYVKHNVVRLPFNGLLQLYHIPPVHYRMNIKPNKVGTFKAPITKRSLFFNKYATNSTSRN